MRKLILFSAIISGLSGAPAFAQLKTQDEIKAQDSAQNLELYQRKGFDAKGFKMPYRLLYPENFDQSKKYPLVMVLHGAGERGDNNESQLAYGAKLFLQPENRQKYPAIVVFPQCPKDSYWSNVNIVTNEDKKRIFNFREDGEPTKAMQALMGLVTELEKTVSVDKTQMYLGGLSMGGMGTFELLRRKPKTFAAAFTICGGAHPATARAFARRVPMWVFHGEVDNVVPFEKSQVMVNAIQKAGGTVRFTLYSGVNHGSWDPAFKERGLLSWLFSHRKE